MTDRELKKRKKQLLLSIKGDIKQLDNYIEFRSKNGFKDKSVVNGKIFLIKLRSIYPYIVSLFCSSCFSYFVLDDIPFVINDVKRRQYIKSEIDSLGNSSFFYQFDKFSNDKNCLTCYSDCVYSDGLYSRDYTVYSMNDFCGFSDIDFSNLDVLYSGTLVSESFISYDSFFKYTSFSLSDDFYSVPESESHNSLFSFYWVLASISCELVVLYFRSYVSNFNCYNSIQNVYRKYLPNGTDIDDIKNILDNRIQNYNLLVKKK